MRLASLRMEGPWRLEELDFGNQNLVVGVNASGKTRLISRIDLLARLVSGSARLNQTMVSRDSHWYATFSAPGDPVIEYELELRAQQVEREVFRRDGKMLLERWSGGRGKIWHETLNNLQDFQSPPTELAVVNRRDTVQHSFFESLSQWASTLFVYYFSRDFQTMAPGFAGPTKVSAATPPPKSLGNVPVGAVLQMGLLSNFEAKFKEAILDDMAALNYQVSGVGMRTAPEMMEVLNANLVGLEVKGLPLLFYVNERDLDAPTDNIEMSQGMGRAFALICYLNFARYSAAKPSALLIDDVGEGLDFRRACTLIQLLQKRAADLKIPLIMTTNDRFVMNSVPIEDWTVLQRAGSLVKGFNYSNSKKEFDEFKQTGLSNFDFLRLDFLKLGREEGAEVAAEDD
jgi:hypothetical protein